MAGDADAAGFLAADQHFALEHDVANVFEADGSLMQRAPVLFGDAVQHLRSGKGFHDVAGPATLFQQPAQ